MSVNILILTLISVESTSAPPVKFATLGRPVKRPMLMASRGEQSQILMLDASNSDAAEMGRC